jgi:hypothetical protein
LDYSQSPGIDLHIHSTASDGTLSPTEILDRAHRLGLAAISITDHDTVDGCRAALDAELPNGLRFLTGVEISAAPPPFFPLSGSLHLLAYGIDLNTPPLTDILEALKDSRLNRNPRIISRLNALDLPVTMEEVLRESANPHQVGRPHIARMLVKKGYVPTFEAAFDTYLGNNQPAYVDKYRVPFDEATAAIKAAGGISVIAHPGLYATGSGLMTDAAMASFKAAGIGGVEVYYPEHSAEQTAHYAALANRHGLLKTGGTDFHGDMKPEVALGSGYGDLHVPADLFTLLMDALAG